MATRTRRSATPICGGHATQEAVGDEGMQLMQKAYAIDPDCPLVLLELAYLQFGASMAAGKPPLREVRRLAERAIDLAPEWYEPHVSLLGQAMVAGDDDDQRQQLEAIVRCHDRATSR